MKKYEKLAQDYYFKECSIFDDSTAVQQDFIAGFLKAREMTLKLGWSASNGIIHIDINDLKNLGEKEV